MLKKLIGCTLLSFGLLLTACTDSDPNVTEEATNEAQGVENEEFDAGEVFYTSPLELGLERRPDAYTYAYVDSIQDAPADANTTDDAFNYSEVDRAPLFSADCVDSENQTDCSYQALARYVSENAEYPETAADQEIESLEYVVFLLDESGRIDDESVRVLQSEGEACSSCVRTAINTVRAMPDWQPALRAGRPVPVRLVLPVRFNIINE